MKKCPHCGQKLHDAAFKCSRCNGWVPNELFERLHDDDVKLIKNNNLTPFTPSLMTRMIISLLKDTYLEKQTQEVLGWSLNGKQRFNLLVFESYCYFNAIRLSAKMKKGCKDIIMSALKAELLNAIIESSDAEEPTRVLKAQGDALYNEFDNIWTHLGTDTPSQVRNTIALASIVYGDKQANIVSGLPLYEQFIDTPIHMREPFEEIFLVQEKDFDWFRVINKSRE
jgi:hypothetical protein